MPISDNLSPTPPKEIEEKALNNIFEAIKYLPVPISHYEALDLGKFLRHNQVDFLEFEFDFLTPNNSGKKEASKPNATAWRTVTYKKQMKPPKIREKKTSKKKADSTKEFLKRKLQNLALKLDRMPTQNELIKASKKSRSTVQRYWGRVVKECNLTNQKIN